jgi:uncharacterized membrane protein (DUF485 family)
VIDKNDAVGIEDVHIVEKSDGSVRRKRSLTSRIIFTIALLVYTWFFCIIGFVAVAAGSELGTSFMVTVLIVVSAIILAPWIVWIIYLVKSSKKRG